MAVRGWVGRGMGVVVVVLLVSCSGGSSTSKEVDEVSSGSTPTTEVSSWSLSVPGSSPAPTMRALEPRQAWVRDVGETIDGQVVIGERFFYATRTGTDSFDVVAVSLADGSELWRRSLQGTITQGTRHEPPRDGGDGMEPALVDHDTYLVARSVEQIVRLDLESGERIWTLDTDDLPYVTVEGRGPNACLGYTETDVTGDSRYHCIGLRDGEELWAEAGYVEAVGEEVTYLRGDSGIVAIDGADGEVLWKVVGATGSLLEVGGMAVVCDARSVYGIDPSGTRQWDLLAEFPTCLRGSSDSILVRELDQVRWVGVDDGEQVGDAITLAEDHYPSAVIDDRYLLTTAYGEPGQVIDSASGDSEEIGPSQEPQPVRSGIIQASNTAWNEPEGPGSWEVSGWDLESGAWAAPVGWTNPGLVPTGAGLLIVDLGYAGNLWFGRPEAEGPSLTEVGEPFARRQVPPEDRVLDGTSVLGVPFGTPAEEAIEELTELLGPPSLWNDHQGDEGYPELRHMWGSLAVEVAEVDGAPRLVGWSDWAGAQGSGWRIAGELRTWSRRDDVEAAGFREVVDSQVCRDGVCFWYWPDATEPVPADIVEAPGPLP